MMTDKRRPLVLNRILAIFFEQHTTNAQQLPTTYIWMKIGDEVKNMQ